MFSASKRHSWQVLRLNHIHMAGKSSRIPTPTPLIETSEVVKKVNRARNRAEAFSQAALRSRKAPEVDSENWEEGRPRPYRIKLKTHRPCHSVQLL